MLKKIELLEDLPPTYQVFQGGMGAGISACTPDVDNSLPVVVGLEGGIGTTSTVALDQIVSARTGEHHNQEEAVFREVRDIKDRCGVVAVNIMRAVDGDFVSSVYGAIGAEADLIFCGAGLPLSLPTIAKEAAIKYFGTRKFRTKLVPIISSGRAARIVIRKWEKQRYSPPALDAEGPKCGGHIGWRFKDITATFLDDYDLFKVLLPEVIDAAGDIPVFAAGGIYTQQDVRLALSLGARAVVLGTRFAATTESGGNATFKQVYFDTEEEDIVVGCRNFASAGLLPFRFSLRSPLAQKHLDQILHPEGEHTTCTCCGLAACVDTMFDKELSRCPEGYLARGNGCPGMGNADYAAWVTMGTNGYRVTEEVSAREVMRELIDS